MGKVIGGTVAAFVAVALIVWGTSGPLSDPSIQPILTYVKLWFAVNVSPKFRNLLKKNESEA